MSTFPSCAVAVPPQPVPVPTYADAAREESYRQACFAVLYYCFNNGSPLQISVAVGCMRRARTDGDK